MNRHLVTICHQLLSHRLIVIIAQNHGKSIKTHWLWAVPFHITVNTISFVVLVSKVHKCCGYDKLKKRFKFIQAKHVQLCNCVQVDTCTSVCTCKSVIRALVHLYWIVYHCKLAATLFQPYILSDGEYYVVFCNKFLDCRDRMCFVLAAQLRTGCTSQSKFEFVFVDVAF